jgi:DNA helicase-2/ATP-dependent DNA helicase PcrA
MDDLVAAAEGDPVAQIQRIRTFYERIMNLRYENAQARGRDLDHIEQVASRYKSRRQLLTDLTLDPPNSTRDMASSPAQDDDRLVLSTIHSAKGCEWEVVYVIHMADGSLPSDKSTGSDKELEEERRLAYVAMTRARDYLYITWPMRVYQRWGGTGDRHGYAQVSRFITDEVRASCTMLSFGAGGEYADEDSHYQGDIIGRVRNQINSRWD